MDTDKRVRAVAVYGASSARLDAVFYEAARAVGRCIAEAGAAVVNGGGARGLMGATIDGALAAGGAAIGVIPEFMHQKGWAHPGLTRLEVTDGMHSRKKLMADLATGVIALPGGVGTLDELMEIITWRQLRLFNGPVVILNTDHYYDPLLAMLEQAERRYFTREHARGRLFDVTTDPAEAVRLALAIPQNDADCHCC